MTRGMHHLLRRRQLLEPLLRGGMTWPAAAATATAATADTCRSPRAREIQGAGTYPSQPKQPTLLGPATGLHSCSRLAQKSAAALASHPRSLSTVPPTSTTKPPLFSKLLVANRGEIACRVMRTARRLGIPTVAIYSDADSDALHVRMADEAVRVGPAAAAQSYLDMDAVLAAVRESGATAVHPGYGFLSENTEFVRRLEAMSEGKGGGGGEVGEGKGAGAGVTFVGPNAAAIHAMGDKVESKRLARAAGVSCIPGVDDIIQSTAEAVAIAKEVGFPVMLKPSGGGGGKGMRIAWNAKEVEEQFELCRAEARSSFADDRVFIERYVDRPRHIEIQVMGDKHGNVVWLPERECSIQRRNQKIIEEAPSTFLDVDTRQAMGEQAVALAKAVGYDSAGTVEFLVDSERNFYFLEMNTRLQVEHPVTECITGLDLVEIMLKVAAGEALPDLRPVALSQARAQRIHGWAMEARVCCEHTGLNFLPSSGQLQRYKEPQTINTVDEIVRVDSGFVEGDDISMHYDSLMAKVVTWGLTRDNAITTMERALDHYYVEGPFNNIAFIRTIVSHPEFERGNLTTKFLDEYFPNGSAPRPLSANPEDDIIPEEEKKRKDRDNREVAAIAVFLELLERQKSLSPSVPKEDLQRPTEVSEKFTVFLDGKEIGAAAQHWPMAHDGSMRFAEVEFDDERILVQQVAAVSSGRGVVDLQLDGLAASCQVIERLPRGYKIVYKGQLKSEVLVMRKDVGGLQRWMKPKKDIDATRLIRSPMPGAVVAIAVQPKDEVVPGDELVTVEAMKMRNVFRAERYGKVRGVFVDMGQIVKPGDMLVEIE